MLSTPVDKSLPVASISQDYLQAVKTTHKAIEGFHTISEPEVTDQTAESFQSKE